MAMQQEMMMNRGDSAAGDHPTGDAFAQADAEAAAREQPTAAEYVAMQ